MRRASEVDGLGGWTHVASVLTGPPAYRVGRVDSSAQPPEGGRKPRVAVVFGGRSSEHSISCISAGSVIAALDPEKYDVVPVGIAADGRWVLESAEPGHLVLGPGGELPSVSGDREVALTPGQGLVVTEPGEVPGVLGEVDVVFPVMHGPWGQDGTLQGLLEMAGVRYVGAGVLSSAVGTDKHFMKQLFLAAGLPVLPYVLVSPRQWERDPATIREAVHALGYPVFVKPARAGSSYGITRVDAPEDLDAAIEGARRVRPQGARRDCRGECARGGDRRAPGARTAAARRPARSRRSRSASSTRSTTSRRSTSSRASRSRPLSTRRSPTQVHDLALRAFEALDVEGLARVDFFVFGDGRVVVNEVETMPGFTATSMFPLLWQESGLTYPELIERLVRLAMERSTGLR